MITVFVLVLLGFLLHCQHLCDQSYTQKAFSPPTCASTFTVVSTHSRTGETRFNTTSTGLPSIVSTSLSGSSPFETSSTCPTTVNDEHVDSMDLHLRTPKWQISQLLRKLWTTLGPNIFSPGITRRCEDSSLAKRRWLESEIQTWGSKSQKTTISTSQHCRTWTKRSTRKRQRTRTRSWTCWQRQRTGHRHRWQRYYATRKGQSSSTTTTWRARWRANVDPSSYRTSSSSPCPQSSQRAYTSRNGTTNFDDSSSSSPRPIVDRASRGYAIHHCTGTAQQWQAASQRCQQMDEGSEQSSRSSTCTCSATFSMAQFCLRSHSEMGAICPRIRSTGHSHAGQYQQCQRISRCSQTGAHNPEDSDHRYWKLRRDCIYGDYDGSGSTSHQVGKQLRSNPRRTCNDGHTTSWSSTTHRRSDRLGSRPATQVKTSYRGARSPTSQGRQQRKCWWWQGWPRFLKGRYACLLQIAYQWPGIPGYLDQGLSWHHSICQEHDFRSPWQASFDGFCTAFEMGFVDKQTAVSEVNTALNPSNQARAAKTVGFHEEIVVQLYSDEEVEATFRIDHEVLCEWDDKPWSLSGTPATKDGLGDAPVDRAEEVQAPRVPGFEWVEVGGEHFDVPPLHFQPQWIQALWPIFSARAREFQRGEGPVAYLRTWFLDSDLVHRWDHWRELRLVPFFDFWQQDLFQLWQDQIRDRTNVEVYIVDPPVPVIPGWENHIVDLIIVQSHSPMKKAILVSTLLQTTWQDRRSLMALYVNNQQPRHDLIRQAGVLFTSWHHPCLIQRGFRALHDGLIRHTQASGLMVTVDQRDDAASFMQTSVTSNARPQLTSDTSASIAPTPPHWEAEVFDLWVQHGTILCSQEGPSLPMQTWYIHHDEHRISFEPRTWQVLAPMATWDRQLRNLWHDFVDPHLSLDINLVTPTPLDAHGLQGFGHLILVQGSQDYAAVLITAIYEQLHAPAFAQAAFSSLRQVDGQYLLRLIGAARPCQEVPCSLWRRPDQLQLDDLITLQDGTSFEVMVPRPPSSDVTSLLSLHSRSSTFGPVAPAAPAPCLNKLSHYTAAQCGSRAVVSAASNFDSQPSFQIDSNFEHLDEASFVQLGSAVPRCHKDEPSEPGWHRTMRQHSDEPIGHLHDHNSETPSGEHRSSGQEGNFDDEPSDPSEPPSEIHSPPEDPNRQSVMLFQYGHVPVHAYVAWNNHDAMMQEIANHCLVPVHRIMYLYDLQFRPLDLQTGIYPMIVHMDFNIDPGSYEQLCLVDVERHGQPHEQHYFTAPNVFRSVMRVPHQLVRNTLLRLVSADDYCASVAQRCIVYFNGENWNLQDPQLRTVHHGAHFRVVLPPREPCPHVDILNAWQGTFEEAQPNSSDGYSPSVLPSDSQSFDLQQLLESDDNVHMQVHSTLVQNKDSHDTTTASGSTVSFSPQVAPAQWVHDLLRSVSTSASFECGDTYNLLVQTWYLSHQHHLRCTHGRSLQLRGPYSEWENQILALWADLIDPVHFINIELVQPTPPSVGVNNFVAQLVVSQHRVPVALYADSHVEVVVTVQFDSTRQPQAHQLALVLPAWSLADDVFDLLQLLQLCQHRRSQGLLCTVHHGPNVFELGLRDLFHNGDSLVVHIPEQPLLNNEVTSLLQVPTSTLRAPISLSNSICENADQVECFAYQPMAFSALHQYFQSHSSETSLNLRTWFLDFNWPTWHFDERLVSLQVDSNSWLPSIHTAWGDVLQGASFDLHTVIGDDHALLGLLILTNSTALPHHRAVVFQHKETGLCLPRVIHCSATAGELVNHARLLFPGKLTARDDSHGIITLRDSRQWSGSSINHADVVQVAQHPASTAATSSATILQLDALICPKKEVRVLVDKLDFLINQIRQTHFPPCFDRTGPVWHPATTQALALIDNWNGEEVLGCHFYTDGSASSGNSSATAAATLLLVTSQGFRWGGYLSTYCLGKPTSQRAESTAILLAIAWMIDIKLQQLVATTVPCFFYFDNITAGFTSFGQWQPKHNLDIVNVSRSLVLWSQSIFQCAPSWHHVKGHTDHEWNEAADRICDFALRSAYSQCDLASYFGSLTFDSTDFNSIQWLWYHQDALQNQPDAPRVLAHHWIFDLDSPFQTQPGIHDLDVIQRQHRDADHARQTFLATFQLATANVLTLGTDAARGSIAFGARAEALAMQFQEAGIHIIGLQETRLRSSGYREFLGFHTFAGPATQRGVGGVQLWVARALCINGHNLRFEQHHFKILAAQSHRLVVRIASKGLRLLCVVLHAPSSTDSEVLHEWWQHTSQVIPPAYRQWRTIYLIDSNSHVGSAPSPAIGDFGAAEENLPGEHFHRWLIQTEAWLPQTFSSSHCGPHPTWTHPTGSQARLDFVALSNDIDTSQVQTWVDLDLDISTQKLDHHCVRARLNLWTFATEPAKRARPKHVQSADQPMLARVPWATNVHSHAALLQQQALAHQCQLPAKPHKWHLSTGTFELIKAKQFHRRRLHAVQRCHRQGVLAAVFSGWKNTHTAAPSCTPWLRQCDHALAWHSYCADQLARHVSREVRAEDQIFYEHLVWQAGHAAEQGLHKVWQTIRQILPKQRKKFNSSLRCLGPAIGEQVQHFCHLEAGEAIDPQQLLDHCHRQQHCSQQEAPLLLPLESFPTRLDIERIGSQLLAGKAAGLDNLRPEVIKQWLSADSHSFSSLITKMWVLAAEPLQWKGGLIHCIAKKNGSDMRGIMILDILGKIWHSILRQKLLPLLRLHRQPLQLGGFQGQQTAFLTHYLRSIAVLAGKHQISSATLFLDIKAAYHSLIREIIFQPDALPPRLRQVLQEQGVDLDVVHHHAHSTNFMDGLDTATLRAATDAHQHTWMTLAKHDQIYQVHRGCRPGSPIADVCFNAIMAIALQELQTFVDEHSVVKEVHPRFPLPTPIAAWVDDVAVPLLATAPDKLDSVLHDVAHFAQQLFASFGLLLNMKPGKTSATVAYRGPLAPQHRKQRHIEQMNFFPLSEHSSLHIAPKYEYLGTTFVPTGYIAEEVRHRINQAHAAFHQVSRRLLHNRHINVKTRLQLLDSLVGSVLLHGSGNWPVLSAQQFTTLSHRYLTWQRQIIGNGPWSSQCQTDLALQQKWRLVPMAVRLMKSRLLYGFQLMQHAPALLVQFATALDLNTDHNWLHGVRLALHWIGNFFPELALANPLTASASVVCDWFHRFKDHGPRAVRKAVYRHLEQEFAAFDIVSLHQDFKSMLTTMGVQFASAATPVASAEAHSAFECALCGALFDTKHRHSVHVWLAHQQVSEERKFAQTAECQSCHKHFWSTARLQQHLRLSRHQHDGCYERLTWRLPPGRQPEVETPPPDLLGFSRLPACQVATVPTLQEAVTLSTRQDALQAIETAWTAEGYPLVPDIQGSSATISTLLDQIHQWRPTGSIDENQPIEWTCTFLASIDPLERQYQATWAFCLWVIDTLKRSSFPHLGLEAFQRLYHALWSFIEATPMGQLLLWHRRISQAYLGLRADLPGLDPRRERPREVVTLALLDQQTLLADCFRCDILNVPQVHTVPLMLWQGKPTIVIFHLFSGRRRVGDCHWWLHGLAETKYTEFPVLVLSLDTAVHATLANLDRGEAFSHVMELATSQCISGCLTGPPCETFSSARHQMLDTPAPRPLRSEDQPWGLTHLKCCETRQHTLGSRLLLHSHSVEAATVLSGGGSIMEHPQEPCQRDRASIWRTALHKVWMQQLPFAHLHGIEQWQYGAKGVKPTALRALGLGPSTHFDAILRQHADPCVCRPSTQLKGRDSNGRFKTAAAKEYPSRLCHAMCDGLLQALTARAARSGFTVATPTTAQVQWIMAVLNASSIQEGSTFLPDYQGR